MDSGGIFCCIIVIVAVGVMIMINNNKSKALAAAHAQYLYALNQLKQNPRDPNLKQEALSYGRKYSFLTRDKRGITTFDEIALMNDLNAATAHAFDTSISQGQPANNMAAISYSTQTQSLNPEDRLRKLDELKNRGMISQEEYVNRRNKILEDL